MMRPKERIPIYLDKVNFRRLVRNWGLPKEYGDAIESNKEAVKDFWLEHPDLVFFQVLQEMTFIPSHIMAYPEEDQDTLLNQGVLPREVLLWENKYDEDKNLLPESKQLLIKDMSTEHIKNILQEEHSTSEFYKKVFEDELTLRDEY